MRVVDYSNQLQSLPSTQHIQCGVSTMCYTRGAADGSRGDLNGIASSLCDTQTSDTEVLIISFNYTAQATMQY